MKKGILLINLGTPDSYSNRSVARYLRQFLMDPFVLDIPAWWRFFLVYFLIVPFRARKSAEAYRKIWFKEGSPLLVYTEQLQKKLQKAMPDKQVEFAMRYGEPSIGKTLDRMKSCSEIFVLPLYPQYAESSTRTAMEEVWKWQKKNPLKIEYQRDFFDQEFFIGPQSEIIQSLIAKYKPDHVLFSFHGLPERHILKVAPECAVCLAQNECSAKCFAKSPLCYKGQCYTTAQMIAEKLDFKNYSVSFQSRLGRTPWIKPYTDYVIQDLPKQNIKKLLVVCGAFTADCLETLEEIGIRASADFKAAGGEELILAPCLNATDSWVKALAEM